MGWNGCLNADLHVSIFIKSERPTVDGVIGAPLVAPALVRGTHPGRTSRPPAPCADPSPASDPADPVVEGLRIRNGAQDYNQNEQLGGRHCCLRVWCFQFHPPRVLSETISSTVSLSLTKWLL